MSAVPAERVLAQRLEHEWMAQSGGRTALVVTPAVREAVELVALSAIDVAGALRDDAPNPTVLMDRVRDRLCESPDPWALRMLARLSAIAPAPSQRPALPSPGPAPALTVYEPPPMAVARPAARRSRWAGLRAVLHRRPPTHTPT